MFKIQLSIFKGKLRDKPKNNCIGSAYSFFFGGTSSGKAVNEVIVKKVEWHITIDSVLKDCYIDEVLKNGDMIVEFPVFKVGENVMGFSENVGKIEVRVNEVWI